VFVKEGEMENTGHLLRKRVWGVLAAAVLCTALVAVASANAARPSEWTAQLPAKDGSSWVDFKVKSKKNKQTKKFSPVAVKKVSVYFLELNCSDNEPAQTSFTWGILKTNPGFPDEIPVSNRRFSLSFTGGEQTADGPGSFTFTFSGRVPRNGPPTGTIRFISTGPQLVPNPADPNGPYVTAQVTCDSGSVSWTAKRLPPNSV
jgi:hypothetical protein